MTLRRFRRTVAVVAALATISLSFPALADGNAMFAGRVVSRDGATPRAGIVVTIVDSTNEQNYRSQPTGAGGVFRIDSAPPGSYAVVAESDEGAYLAAERVTLVAGDNPVLQLALNQGAQPRLAPGQTPGPPPTGGGGGGALSGWAGGVIAGALIVVGIVAFDKLTESEASKSQPF